MDNKSLPRQLTALSLCLLIGGSSCISAFAEGEDATISVSVDTAISVPAAEPAPAADPAPAASVEAAPASSDPTPSESTSVSVTEETAEVPASTEMPAETDSVAAETDASEGTDTSVSSGTVFDAVVDVPVFEGVVIDSSDGTATDTTTDTSSSGVSSSNYIYGGGIASPLYTTSPYYYATASGYYNWASNASYAYNQLVSAGFTPAAACGVLGNMFDESRFNTYSVNSSSGAFGLCQWLGSRKTNLFSWCSAKGYDAYSVSGQVAYLLQVDLGVNAAFFSSFGTYCKSVSGYKSLTDPRQAANDWCRAFERPGTTSAEIWSFDTTSRQNVALQLYNWLALGQQVSIGDLGAADTSYSKAVSTEAAAADSSSVSLSEEEITSEAAEQESEGLTRQELVLTLWEYADSPIYRTGDPYAADVGSIVYTDADLSVFTDLSENSDYYIPFLWAYSNGIISGSTETTMSPDRIVTRAEVVTVLYRYAEYLQSEATDGQADSLTVDTEQEMTPAEALASDMSVVSGVLPFHEFVFEPETTVPDFSGLPFTDLNVEDYYYCVDYVRWAYENGICSGTSDTTFSPADSCTAKQLELFAVRIDEYLRSLEEENTWKTVDAEEDIGFQLN